MPRLTKALSSLSSDAFAIHASAEGSQRDRQRSPQQRPVPHNVQVAVSSPHEGDRSERLSQVEFLKLTALFKLQTRVLGGNELTAAFFDLVRDAAPAQFSSVFFAAGEGVQVRSTSPNRGGRSPSPARQGTEDLAREAWLLGGLKLGSFDGPHGARCVAGGP